MMSVNSYKPWVVVITGGVASGKSTVGEFFLRWGAKVIDTDVISRSLTTTDGAAMPAIVKAFAEVEGGVLNVDGSLNRATMRALVLANPALRKRLEAILHPLIAQEKERLIGAPPYAPIVAIQIPLFTETGARRMGMYQAANIKKPMTIINRVLTVECPIANRIKRLMRYRGMTHEEAVAMIAAQCVSDERRRVADNIIENQENLAKLERISFYYFRQYQQYASIFVE